MTNEEYEAEKARVWDIISDGPKSWIGKVEQDPDNPEECILTFPEELLQRVGWYVGDEISWEVLGDDTAILRKV